MIPHEIREWVERYLNGGYYPAEVVSIIGVEHDLDEFQIEDLEKYVTNYQKII